jgi:LPXTG-motif cell wall-anchored protein
MKRLVLSGIAILALTAGGLFTQACGSTGSGNTSDTMGPGNGNATNSMSSGSAGSGAVMENDRQLDAPTESVGDTDSTLGRSTSGIGADPDREITGTNTTGTMDNTTGTMGNNTTGTMSGTSGSGSTNLNNDSGQTGGTYSGTTGSTSGTYDSGTSTGTTPSGGYDTSAGSDNASGGYAGDQGTLPSTGSDLPLVALIGLLALGLAFVVRAVK